MLLNIKTFFFHKNIKEVVLTMGELYYLPKNKKKDSESTLSDFLRSNNEGKTNQFFDATDDIILCDFKKLKAILLQNINNVLFDSSCLNSNYFHCGLYVADLITKTVENPPKSFYAIDYLTEIDSDNKYYGFKEAGDICFLICSIFTKRCNHGLMTYKSYSCIGRSMYATFYSKSKKEIGYLMSDNYEDMVRVTKTAINALLK